MSTDIDLAALTALEQAATPGPWATGCEGGYIIHGPKGTVCEAYGENDSADAALIVALRNQFSALLERMVELEYELSQIHEDSVRLTGGLAAGHVGDGWNCTACGQPWPCPTMAAASTAELARRGGAA